MKILLAEDDLVTRKFLTAMLAKLGHEVTAVADGRSALEYFNAYHPPLIISDWQMPQLDGVELCQSIRIQRLEQYTFFLLLSARSERADYLKAMDAGVDDFLNKSVNIEELGIRIRVAERIILQREVAERKIRALALFPADNPNPILQVDRQSRIVYANRASIPLLEQWGSQPGSAAPEQIGRLSTQIPENGDRRELEMACADRIYLFSVTSVSSEGVAYVYGHDITDRKRAEDELLVLKNKAEENALHDQLTGLPNRRFLMERLRREAIEAARLETKLGLVIVDIDNFKQINDGYGHNTGDKVIVAVGDSLRNSIRGTDAICRWGGDELVLLLVGLKAKADLARICCQLMETVRRDICASGLGAPVSISMGSAVFPDDTADETVLMQQADHALYLAKGDGRNCWRAFNGFPAGHDAKGAANIFLRLGHAVAEGGFTVYYQPIVRAGSDQVVGAEALARWHDPELGWIAPDVFIPMAEQKGYILPLGYQVLSQALDQLSEWRTSGHDLSISINLSKRQVLDADFRSTLLEMIQVRGLKPDWVILEITERQSLLDHVSGRRRLEELAASGFNLSIDDFGTGYSSFDLVGEAAFRELKINLTLTRQSNDPRGRRVVQAIIEMARTLGLVVVAEGVEDLETREALVLLGVQKLQGYLYSRPISAPEFDSFLKTTKDWLTKNVA